MSSIPRLTLSVSVLSVNAIANALRLAGEQTEVLLMCLSKKVGQSAGVTFVTSWSGIIQACVQRETRVVQEPARS